MFTAYKIHDDGKNWLHVTNQDTGEAWEEPIAGWALVINLINGLTVWRHMDGREYTDRSQ